jgi:hypothetical protein
LGCLSGINAFAFIIAILALLQEIFCQQAILPMHLRYGKLLESIEKKPDLFPAGHFHLSCCMDPRA